MADFHFVEDYVSHVRDLIDKHPMPEAMSLAVGGLFDQYGVIERDIMLWAGLKDGQRLLDFGCGSGRLATALSKVLDIGYFGVDVVQELLDYAATICPKSYEFKLNRSLKLPLPSNSVDMVSSFSVFTHLLHAETYLYLEEMHRCLKPGGVIVGSFLEFHEPIQWPIFAGTVEQLRNSTNVPLNQYVERNQWLEWTRRLGFSRCEFVSGSEAPWSSGALLGQSLAVITK